MLALPQEGNECLIVRCALTTNIKLEYALFEVRTEISWNRNSLFRFKNIVREHHVYEGALNKKYFDNRIKPAPNSEDALISEICLTTREYGNYLCLSVTMYWGGEGTCSIACLVVIRMLS